MARRRKTIKRMGSRGKIRRDKNGKFVNKSGTNRSKGYNRANLRKGQQAAKKAAAKRKVGSTSSKPKTKIAKKKSKSRAAAEKVALAAGAYHVNRYANKAKGAAEGALDKVERKAIDKVKSRLGTTKVKPKAKAKTKSKARPKKRR